MFALTISSNSQLVPLDTTQNQTWQVALQIDGSVKIFLVLLKYNAVAGYWVMNVQDTAGRLLAASQPLLTGADLFAQFHYLGLGTAAMLNVSNTPVDSPNNANLGTDFKLFWGDTVAA